MLLYDDYLPQNHKFFSNIVTGLIGLKNYIYWDERKHKVTLSGGITAYCTLMNCHFTRYRKGERENTLEYA